MDNEEKKEPLIGQELADFLCELYHDEIEEFERAEQARLDEFEKIRLENLQALKYSEIDNKPKTREDFNSEDDWFDYLEEGYLTDPADRIFDFDFTKIN